MNRKRRPAQTSPTSIRLSATGIQLWDKLAETMGLSKIGVIETALRFLAKHEGVTADGGGLGANYVDESDGAPSNQSSG